VSGRHNERLRRPPGFSRRIRRGGLAGALVAVLSCQGDPRGAGETETHRQPIWGGAPVTTCQWPTTVSLSGGCTATLVHPSIVTTAGHCGSAQKYAVFGETLAAPARRVAIEYCRVFKASAAPALPPVPNTLRDWAFCKLQVPVTDVPIVPILMGCETEALVPGAKVIVAGFGASATGTADGYGTKRWVETTINRVDSGHGIQVGGMGKAPCYGDSGGPAYIRLGDGSWRVFGIDSTGLAASCAAGDLMALIHPAVPWIEQQSGVDITPCHDADGTWHPSAGCGAFSVAPDAPGRQWSNGCAEPTVSAPSATCGPPAVPVPDDAGAPGDARGAEDGVGAPPADSGPVSISIPDADMTAVGQPPAGGAGPDASAPPGAAAGDAAEGSPHAPAGGCACGLAAANADGDPRAMVLGCALLALALAVRRRSPR
jgi:hypothetical protein